MIRLYQRTKCHKRNKKLICVVRNTKTGILFYFAYDGVRRGFVVCDALGVVDDDAVIFSTPRSLINAMWPSKKGHSVMAMIYLLDGQNLKKLAGIFICWYHLLHPLIE